MSISVIGAGAFGTALGIALGRTRPVTLWGRDPDKIEKMKADRRNDRHLPGVAFPENLSACPDLESVLAAEILLLALPMQALAGFVATHDLSGVTAVACCKGIDIETGLGPSRILAVAKHAAVLTGPSFADDIARGLPTALTLACADAVAAKTLQEQLSTPTLRLYRTSDVVGAELGGALKNVVAIGCGAVIGAGLGDSARAALMTRGFAEMRKLAAHYGAQAETLSGLSGLGDLALTCTSDTSRNYRLGLALGAGTDFDANVTVEGAATSRALRKVAADTQLDLPVCLTVADLVDGEVDIGGAMDRLLTRPLKEE